MKESPKMQKLEAMLRSSVFVAGGFMGSDPRPVTEVIDADATELARLDVTPEQLADRMQICTDAAIKGLGNWVTVDAVHEAKVEEARGWIPCPWSDGCRCRKRVTTLRRTDKDRTVQWSDLSIHFITAHGFFEGQGSFFRLEPAELVHALF
jgi:hypothetical protein